MIRVATIPLQRTLSGAIQSAQKKLADTQEQLTTGKKANDLAALGTEAGRTLSARSLRSTQEAQSASAGQLTTTLSLYDANIQSIDDSSTDLRQKIMTAIGTGEGQGLAGAITGAFAQFRAALNASDGSGPLFGGAQTGSPFTLNTLADTVGATPATAFTNDGVRASARLAEGIDVTYGVGASELGTGMLAAFRTLAEVSPIGDKPTDAQVTALKTAMGQIDTALPNVRAINAENGRKQAQTETLGTRADDRADLLSELISKNEDADYGEIAMQLSQSQTILQASYSVFSRLSQLSLTQYLN